VVRQGDTLYSLSRRHGVPVAELVTANRISDGKIRTGQMLVIPAQTR
jgi:LysM repeat protein